VQDTIDRESHRSDFLRRVRISTTWGPAEPDKPLEEIAVVGEMSDAKRARIREAIRKNSGEKGPQRNQAITRDKLNEIAGWPHVVDVEPISGFSANVGFNSKSEETYVRTARTADNTLPPRLVAGRTTRQ
jgi:putative ABC transport system permease protein